MSIHSASPVDNAENQGPLLRVDKVSLEYKTPERRVRATHQVSFDVHASERFILLGPSGCGKSTLLKAVAGFIKPTEGRIALDDRPVQGPARTASWCSRNSTSCRRGRRCGRTSRFR